MSKSSAIVEYNPSESTNNGEHENTVILDSLPYVDNIHPDYETYALSLIEEEMQTMQPRSDALNHLFNPLEKYKTVTIQNEPHDIPPSFTKTQYRLNENEYKELLSREGQPRTSSSLYSPQIQASTPQDVNDASQWEEAVTRAKIEVEHERIRLLNAELQSEYESHMWKHHIESLDSQYVQPMKQRLQQQQMRVDKINSQRKDMQEKVTGPKLLQLETKWADLISKNQRLTMATIQLRDEVEAISIQHGISINDEEIKAPTIYDTDDD